MAKKNERLTEAASAHIDNTCDFMQASLESIEKVAKLQFEVSKRVLEDASDAVKDMSSATNPKEFFDRLSQLTTQSVESHICTCRDLYDIMAEVQSNVGRIIETNLQTTQQHITSAVEDLAQYSPVNNTASESVKSWLNGANQAMNTMNKMASQVSEFANTNLKAATAASMNAVNVAKKAAATTTAKSAK